MKDTNLVDVLRAYEEWAEWNLPRVNLVYSS